MAENTLRALQLAELEIFREILRICQKYELTTYLMGGTLLGAVRHNGFIPWDDDMDIGLARPDFEKLLAVLGGELPEGMQLISYRTSDVTDSYIPKVINRSLSILDQSALREKRRYAWVDLFPLDGMPNRFLLRRLHQLRLLFDRMLYKFSVFDEAVCVHHPNSPLYDRMLLWIGSRISSGRFLNPRERLEILDGALRKYAYGGCKFVVNFMGAYRFREMVPRKCYGKGATYLFEGLQVNGPAEADRILTRMYGDYRTPPPVSEQNKHCIRVLGDEKTV